MGLPLLPALVSFRTLLVEDVSFFETKLTYATLTYFSTSTPPSSRLQILTHLIIFLLLNVSDYLNVSLKNCDVSFCFLPSDHIYLLSFYLDSGWHLLFFFPTILTAFFLGQNCYWSLASFSNCLNAHTLIFMELSDFVSRARKCVHWEV